MGPHVPTFWDYGFIPETIGDEGEALDAILIGDPIVRPILGEVVQGLVIGVLRMIDGWKINDDKIIVIPASDVPSRLLKKSSVFTI